jgi:hypothetical protein
MENKINQINQITIENSPKANEQKKYFKLLMELRNKYNVNLTKNFSLSDDPDEMRFEYELHCEIIKNYTTN